MIFPCLIPWLPTDYDIPPTIYALLNSYVNYDNDEKTKISDLASVGRGCIFDFEYPLSSHISKADFETLILNHYMMRRIGYETLTAFKIALNAKLNEVMPTYNKLFDALSGWNLFTDGEIETRVTSDQGTNSLINEVTTQNQGTSDRRYSRMPQNEIENIKDGNYMTDYNFDTSNDNGNSQSTSNGTNTNETNETITRTPADKMSVYKDFLENKTSIYTMLFKDLDDLFYGLI